jgi:hypothetical protein
MPDLGQDGVHASGTLAAAARIRLNAIIVVRGLGRTADISEKVGVGAAWAT